MRKLTDTADRSLYQQKRIDQQPKPRYSDDVFERFINLRKSKRGQNTPVSAILIVDKSESKKAASA